MSLRIGILVLAVGRQGGGPETYERELLRALARIDRTNAYTIYCTNDDSVRAVDVAQANFSFQVLRPRSRLLSLSLSLPTLMRRHRVEVLHATFAPPPFWPAKLVFTSHGLVNFNFPQFFPRHQRLRLNALHRMAMLQAQQIICVSEHTHREMQESMRIERSRLHLIHHGVSPMFQPRAKLDAQRDVSARWGVQAPYLLFVGKLQQVKNIDRLLEAFSRFRRQHCPAMKLVLAGRPVEAIPSLHRPDLNTNVVQLGYVASTDLPALYQAAEMLILPSLFESFGLPVLEAMSCGTPVIASRAGALPEICGDAALMIDPLGVEEMAASILQMFQSQPLRDDLRAKGFHRAEAFSWDAAARGTLRVYEQAAGSPGSSA